MEEKIKLTNPTLHKYLFTITTFSKLLAMFLFILLPFVGFYLGMKYQVNLSTVQTNVNSNNQTVCPQDSKKCPNGSYVGRTGSNCAFAECSGVIPTRKPSITALPTSTIPIIKGINTYTNTKYGFQLTIPIGLETKCNINSNECYINKSSDLPRGRESNFIWFTVVPSDIKDRTYQNSAVYNFSGTDELTTMNVNEKKVIPASNSNLSDSFTYQRLNDISINGQNAKVFINSSPWEFPKGTLEKIIIINYKNYLYTIGSYAGGYISLDVFNQIFNTFKFTN